MNETEMLEAAEYELESLRDLVEEAQSDASFWRKQLREAELVLASIAESKRFVDAGDELQRLRSIAINFLERGLG